MPAYDPRTALLVVDVQHDFADPIGSLYVRGAEEIVPVLNGEIAAATDAGALVVYTQDWHPESTPHFEKDGGVWPVHCVHDTWGAEFHADLRVADDAPTIRKGGGGEDGYSAFSVRDPRSGESWETSLGGLLRDRLIRRLVIGGLTTDYCVVESVSDARARLLEVDVLTSAIRAVDLRSGDGQRALERMRDVGAVLA
ncbi:MAG TPA: isochorismatase family protein [Actinomycetota bacterium]|nr:isochorismatase family protein [Actinomycetota bacterium]